MNDSANQQSKAHKVKRRADSASYRMIVKLKQMFLSEKRAKDRYRKKLDRQQKRLEAQMVSRNTNEVRSLDTPRTKTKRMLADSTVTPIIRKTLVFHNALVDEITATAREVKSEKHKRLVSKFIRGRLLKRSRVCNIAETLGIRVSKDTTDGESSANFDDKCRQSRSDAVDNDTVQL